MNIDDNIIGDNIKRKRSDNGLTQSDLSDKLHISVRTLQKYESGEIKPPFKKMEKIADALGVPVSELLFTEQHQDTFSNLVNKSASHVVDDIYPLVEYINENRFDGKFNVKDEFKNSDLIDLAGLIDDIVANRFISVINRNKNV